MDQLDEVLTCRLDLGRKIVEPCSIVIFGASGDLTSRKLIPALYHLFVEKRLPTPFRIIGFARREKSDESFRQELKEALQKFSRSKAVDNALWEQFATNLRYCQGDLGDLAVYKKLAQMLEGYGVPQLRKNLLFYLSIAPTQFSQVAEQLSRAGLLLRQHSHDSWQRVVVEKPFGQDLASAHALNSSLTQFAQEKQIYRIDHYLGKETVQNILMFRFSNSIFEQLWNRQSVDHVQITVSEKLGVGSRAGYYEEAGAIRDMLQNHLLQVLALVAMEPPVSLEAESVRDEKVKLLNAIRRWQPQQVASHVVRGQYTAGSIGGQPCPAYRSEPKVSPAS
ncbi:MAG: glucose-6-phosphate dehydrogenase, partial [Verrucomicrobia bacterium]|nr:glucose-6-phosphate dehydrogenase [Verrucomicrobiota bacterium]